MAARWVGQNSGPIFRRLWTKEHQTEILMFLGRQISGEGATQISDRILQICVTIEHMAKAKFGDDRPSDLGY